MHFKNTVEQGAVLQVVTNIHQAT